MEYLIRTKRWGNNNLYLLKVKINKSLIMYNKIDKKCNLLFIEISDQFYF
jgi:hypothetical protein